MPLATGIIGCNMIYEHGDAMMKFGGKATEASRRYIEDANIVGRVKTWNPFTGQSQQEKQLDDKEGPLASPSPPRSWPCPIATFLPIPATDRSIERPPAYEDAMSPWLQVATTVPLPKATRPKHSTLVRSPEDDFGAFQTAQPPAQLLSLRPIHQQRDVSVTSTVHNEELIDLGMNEKRRTVDPQRPNSEVQPLYHKSGGIHVKSIDSEASLLDLGPEDNPWT